ncbi:hypothetical protein BHU72_00835 [Desulfuribacillus stibiiarsenatis]|uniref:Uncharacterized protein n=2 Tax=Desulfuribacillus stibiiarsenatis TaxID=1390249 RepID=A0A1E5LA81_9FIRM|nr:hypothetical protein BHU72_00835 [Desulfuribacillus stibiiarsenatis]
MAPDYELVKEMKWQLWVVSLNHWYFDDIRKWTWWLSLAFTVVPLYIWWKVVDKKRLLEIVIIGLLANITSSFLDIVGSEAVLWGYPDRLFPNLPRVLPVDFTVIPVTYMLIYQYFPTWKHYIIAIVSMSLLFSFVAEPILVAIGLYEIYYWEYIYSFPIYIAMGIVIRWLTDTFRNIYLLHNKH